MRVLEWALAAVGSHQRRLPAFDEFC